MSCSRKCQRQITFAGMPSKPFETYQPLNPDTFWDFVTWLFDAFCWCAAGRTVLGTTRRLGTIVFTWLSAFEILWTSLNLFVRNAVHSGRRGLHEVSSGTGLGRYDETLCVNRGRTSHRTWKNTCLTQWVRCWEQQCFWFSLMQGLVAFIQGDRLKPHRASLQRGQLICLQGFSHSFCSRSALESHIVDAPRPFFEKHRKMFKINNFINELWSEWRPVWKSPRFLKCSPSTFIQSPSVSFPFWYSDARSHHSFLLCLRLWKDKVQQKRPSVASKVFVFE